MNSTRPQSIMKALVFSQTVSLVFLAIVVFLLCLSYLAFDQREQKASFVRNFGETLTSLLRRPLSQGDFVLIDSTIQASGRPEFVSGISLIRENDEVISEVRTGEESWLPQEIVFPFVNMEAKWLGTDSVFLRIDYNLDALLAQGLFLFGVLALTIIGALVLSIKLSRKGIQAALRPLLRMELHKAAELSSAELQETTPPELVPFVNEIAVLSERLRKQAVKQKSVEMARKVAHDIRSPLSALRMLSQNATTLPVMERQLLRSVTKRINEIAGELLKETRRKRNEIERVDLHRLLG